MTEKLIMCSINPYFELALCQMMKRKIRYRDPWSSLEYYFSGIVA